MDRGRLALGAAIVALAVGLGACGPELPREFGKPEVDAIKKAAEDFVAAYNAKESNKVAMSFSGGAVLMPPNAATLRGFESIKGYYDSRFAEGAGDLVIEPKDVNGHGPLAYLSGDYSFKNHPAEGPETRDRGKFVWIVRNLAGQWKWEYQIWNSDLAPAPPPPPPEPVAPKAGKKK